MNKGLEAITSPVSTELKNGKQFYTYTKEDVETIEKEIKALGIIVSKVQLGGFIDSLKQTKNYEEYKNTYITLLTEEEYELLKEVLKND